MKFWHHYHYKHLTLIGISIVIAFYLLQNSAFSSLLHHLGNWGYLGAFLGGILFVCTFTISIGAVILFILANNGLSILEIALFAALGEVTFDFIVFHFIRSKELENELKELFDKFGGYKLRHLIKTKYFSWTLPVIGAVILASPLPDELGVSLMGISKMKQSKFLVTAFILDFVGVFFVVTAAKIL